MLLRIIALLAASSWLVSPPALADDIFVAPGGADAADRGSEAEPLATIRYAVGLASAGDRVLVAAGEYAGFHVDLAGTADAPIEFIAMGEVTITSENDFTNRDGINVEGASYIVIDGFTVRGMDRAGLRAAESDHVTFRRNTAADNGVWGIFTGCVPDMVIEDNATSGSVDEHGIYHSNSGDRPIIRRNVSFDNNANGIHMNGDASIDCATGDSDGVISNAIVEENVIYGNGAAGGSGINCDGVADSVVRSNLIYDTHASGISLYQIDAGGPAVNNRVLNNTVIVAPDGRWALNIRDGATGTLVRNNILLTDHAFRGAIVVSEDSLTGFDSDSNVLVPRLSQDGDATVLDLTEWQALGHDPNSFLATPEELFVNAAGDDYHLRDGSPAIDAGDAETFAERAVDGAARDGEPDIGAYEHGSSPGGDAGVPDAGPVDGGGSPDAGSPDAGSPDAGSPDAGSPEDGGPADSGSPDARSPDGGSPRDVGSAPPPVEDDGGCSCRVPSDASRTAGDLAPFSFVLALWLGRRCLRRRRR